MPNYSKHLREGKTKTPSWKDFCLETLPESDHAVPMFKFEIDPRRWRRWFGKWYRETKVHYATMDCVCVSIYLYIKLHITLQSGPDVLIFQYCFALWRVCVCVFGLSVFAITENPGPDILTYHSPYFLLFVRLRLFSLSVWVAVGLSPFFLLSWACLPSYVSWSLTSEYS